LGYICFLSMKAVAQTCAQTGFYARVRKPKRADAGIVQSGCCGTASPPVGPPDPPSNRHHPGSVFRLLALTPSQHPLDTPAIEIYRAGKLAFSPRSDLTPPDYPGMKT
jgi:hypothetical protein